jgi:hypothetical protein
MPNTSTAHSYSGAILTNAGGNNIYTFNVGGTLTL